MLRSSMFCVAGLRSCVMYESVAELEKIYKTAIVGPEEERPAAASILCGASLIRSWPVQVYFFFTCGTLSAYLAPIASLLVDPAWECN
jgi:hypothetical protein